MFFQGVTMINIPRKVIFQILQTAFESPYLKQHHATGILSAQLSQLSNS